MSVLILNPCPAKVKDWKEVIIICRNRVAEPERLNCLLKTSSFVAE